MYIKKRYKSPITMNHKITKNVSVDGVPLKRLRSLLIYL